MVSHTLTLWMPHIYTQKVHAESVYTYATLEVDSTARNSGKEACLCQIHTELELENVFTTIHTQTRALGSSEGFISRQQQNGIAPNIQPHTRTAIVHEKDASLNFDGLYCSTLCSTVRIVWKICMYLVVYTHVRIDIMECVLNVSLCAYEHTVCVFC